MNNLTLTPKQNEVFLKAKDRIENKEWFSGVCIDSLSKMTDQEIDEMGFDQAVSLIITETMYWDCPM